MPSAYESPALRVHYDESLLLPHRRGFDKNRPVEDVFTVQERDDLVVRVADFRQLRGDGVDWGVSEVSGNLATGEALLAELHDELDIRIPRHLTVLANQEGPPPNCKFYSLVERIDGKPLDNFESLSDIHEEVDLLTAGLANYLFKKHLSQEPFLRDVFLARQYMWGKSTWDDADAEPELFMPDLDSLYINIAKENEKAIHTSELKSKTYYTGMFTRKLGEMLLGLEKHTDERLENARGAYSNLMWEIIADTNKGLQGNIHSYLNLKSLVRD